jgi:ribosomal RNA-processing protein 1
MKLWKGLYYCMWMCDRMRVQQRLADDLADLVSVLQPNNTILFIKAFWATLSIQWPILDQHRYGHLIKDSDCSLDKFYLLARRYVAAGFRFLQSRDWQEDYLRDYNKMLTAGPLQYVPYLSIVTLQPNKPKDS